MMMGVDLKHFTVKTLYFAFGLTASNHVRSKETFITCSERYKANPLLEDTLKREGVVDDVVRER